MPQVYLAADPLDAHLVKGFLESHGIEAIVRGETLFALRGEVPLTTDTLPTVWIVEDGAVARRDGPVDRVRGQGRALPPVLETDDAAAAAEALKGNGVRLVKDVHETAWGTREFVIKDDQGHTLYFGESR